MKLLKKISTVVAVIGFSAMASISQAVEITITGTIDAATGALASLTPPGTAFSGTLNWDDGSGTLIGGQVLLGGFCFTDDASGLPPTSPTCGALSAVPLLNTGGPVYDGTLNAGPYDQAGTTFDGTSGDINILAFSPTFNVNIPIAITLNGDGTGAVLADAGVLGTASGPLTYTPSAVPVPAAAWLFGSALVGLAGVGRSRKAA